MGTSKWDRIRRQHDRHLRSETGYGGNVDAVSVCNRGTDRQLNVNVCRTPCKPCNDFMKFLLWNRDSPLRDASQLPLEVAEIS